MLVFRQNGHIRLDHIYSNVTFISVVARPSKVDVTLPHIAVVNSLMTEKGKIPIRFKVKTGTQVNQKITIAIRRKIAILLPEELWDLIVQHLVAFKDVFHMLNVLSY